MNRIAILMYHRIEAVSKGSRFVCTVQSFEQQMRWLRNSGLPLVSLEDVARAARNEGTVTNNAVAVTFDDGHESFYRYALPVLQKLDIPATMFVVAGKLGDTDDWMPENHPRMPLMTAEQVRELPSRGVTVGSHSLTHARLPALDEASLIRELGESRERLSEMLGRPVDLLAYPYGLHDERVARAARQAGYSAACSTRSGFNATGVDPFALRRIDVYGHDSLWQFRRKIEFGINDYSFATHLRYYWTRLATAASVR